MMAAGTVGMAAFAQAGPARLAAMTLTAKSDALVGRMNSPIRSSCMPPMASSCGSPTRTDGRSRPADAARLRGRILIPAGRVVQSVRVDPLDTRPLDAVLRIPPLPPRPTLARRRGPPAQPDPVVYGQDEPVPATAGQALRTVTSTAGDCPRAPQPGPVRPQSGRLAFTPAFRVTVSSIPPHPPSASPPRRRHGTGAERRPRRPGRGVDNPAQIDADAATATAVRPMPRPAPLSMVLPAGDFRVRHRHRTPRFSPPRPPV